jgi:PTS system nitrogen regulatory IIA component
MGMETAQPLFTVRARAVELTGPVEARAASRHGLQLDRGDFLTAHLRAARFNACVDEPFNAGRGLLHLDCVLTDADIATPVEAFEVAARMLAAAHGLDARALADRLCQREGRGSTALGNGIALPHADAWGTSRPHAAFVRSLRPLGFFPTIDREPVHEVLVLVAPRPATGLHHMMLQHYRALAGDAGFRASLRDCADPEAIWRLFREHEWNRDPRRDDAALRRKSKRRPAAPPIASSPLTAS